MCEKRVARSRRARAKRSVPDPNHKPNPRPRPKPKTSTADVAERGVASINVRSSGDLCVEEEHVLGEAGARSSTYAYTRVDSPAGLLDLPEVGLL